MAQIVILDSTVDEGTRSHTVPYRALPSDVWCQLLNQNNNTNTNNVRVDTQGPISIIRGNNNPNNHIIWLLPHQDNGIFSDDKQKMALTQFIPPHNLLQTTHITTTRL